MADIYGQLVKAQLEHSASDLANVTGLVYYNSSSNIVKWYDGTAWRTAVDTASTQTLSNKTLTAPVMTTPTLGVASATSETITGTGGNGFLALTEQNSDPSTPASGIVRVYAGTEKKLYLKNSDGTETAVGSGAGEKNYITGSSTAAGWSNVGDLDVATSTTAAELPREFTTASGIKITADSNTQSVADYVYHDFTLDDVDQSKKLKIQWSQKVTGTYTDGQLAVVITTQADRTTAVHTPVVTAIPSADGVFSTTVDVGTTATLSLVIRATGDMTTDGGIVISDVVVGPGIQPQGAVVSAWTSFTPSWTNAPGRSSETAFWRRVGDSMELDVNFKTTGSGGGASALQFTLPLSLNLDTSKAPAVQDANAFGVAWFDDASGATLRVLSVVRTAGTTNFAFVTEGTDDSVDGVEFDNSAESFAFRATIPIAEWAGSGTINVAQNDVEYSSNNGTWDAADTTSFVYGPGGSIMGGALTESRAKRVQFQTAISVTDELVVEVSDDRTTWLPVSSAIVNSTPIRNATSSTDTLSTGSGVYLTQVSSTQVNVTFARYQSIANDDSPASDWGSATYWRVKKKAAGAAVGFGLATTNSAGLVNPYIEGSGVVYSGTYTPTTASASNYTVSNVRQHNYIRIGNMVTVFGKVAGTVTTTGNDTSFTVTLPVATANFADSFQSPGSGCHASGAEQEAVECQGLSGTQTVQISVQNTIIDSATASAFNYSFCYKIQ